MPIILTTPPKRPKLSDCQFFWKQTNGEYRLELLNGEYLNICADGGKWYGRAFLHGHMYVGEPRATLEEMFKAIDRVFYKAYPEFWTKTDVSVVIAPWSGELNGNH